MRMLRLLSVLCLLFAAPAAFAQDPPKNELDLRTQIESARSAQEFDGHRGELDVLRTLAGAGVQLSPAEMLDLGREALFSGLSIEAEAALTSLAAADNALLAEPSNARMWNLAKMEAAQDRGGAVEEDAALVDASRFPMSQQMVLIAESLLAMGEHQRAINMFRTALASERLPDELATSARLSLCRALLAAGRPSEARWELENFPPAPGYDVLARAWLAVAIQAEHLTPTSDPSSPPQP
jgi:tetratricopeptide (TPR) repeat protein